MQIGTRLENIRVLIKQRNILLILNIITLICLSFVSLKLFLTSEKIVLVPGLNQEAWVSDGKVSSSYARESAAMYLPLLLDLDKASIDWVRDRILSHVAVSDGKSLEKLNKYFARAKEHYNNFSLSTHFALKKLDVDETGLIAIAHGQLISRFGNRGMESEAAKYRLVFKWSSGRLLLKAFNRLVEEEDR